MKDTRIVDIDLVEPNPYQPRLEFDDEALIWHNPFVKTG